MGLLLPLLGEASYRSGHVVALAPADAWCWPVDADHRREGAAVTPDGGDDPAETVLELVDRLRVAATSDGIELLEQPSWSVIVCAVKAGRASALT